MFRQAEWLYFCGVVIKWIRKSGVYRTIEVNRGEDMKLSADIVFDGLYGRFPMEMAGPKVTELRLERPMFFDGSCDEFLADHLYITRTERLPRRAVIPRGVVLICSGDGIQLSYYREQCCVIQLKDGTDIFTLFNAVQELYDMFDTWRDRLQEILDRNADVEEMLACSWPIFETQMLLIDKNFRYLAHYNTVDAESSLWGNETTESLGLPELGKFLEFHELATNEREPLLLNLLDTTTLNVNLFDRDTFVGCLTLDYKGRTHRKGDIELVKILAAMLTRAILKFTASEPAGDHLLRAVLQDVVDGLPADYAQRRALEHVVEGREYICVKMELNNRLAKLPVGYICSEVESRFPNSVSFERKGAAMCFIETASLMDKGGNAREALEAAMEEFTETMGVRIGVSDAFRDVYSARLYYHQASAALENGTIVDPAKKYYRFQDYALTELIINSLGKMPTELFFSEGMRRLAAHDAEAPVSYIDTLRTYLDQNMSMTRTSAALYVHRSTLLERIGRIERELDTDLKDPDERLRIQILLKALQIHQQINVRKNSEA